MPLVAGELDDRWLLLSNEDLVLRVLAGETALFEVLIRRCNRRLYRAVRGIIRNEGEVEDVLQQAYVNAYGNLRQFDGRAAFSTWLTRIAVHEALARSRRSGRNLGIHLDDAALADLAEAGPAVLDPERLAQSGELGSLIERAIDRLPDGTREVFILRQIEGMTTAAVADVLGVSDIVVKTRLSRARAALRRDLLQAARVAAEDVFRFLRPRCDRVTAAVLNRIEVPPLSTGAESRQAVSHPTVHVRGGEG
jgi:RNA polymerase sigma-70 factor (ECF subfamily)